MTPVKFYFVMVKEYERSLILDISLCRDRCDIIN